MDSLNKQGHNDNNDDDENRRDFELLLKRTKTLDLKNNNDYSEENALARNNDLHNNDIWPLYLNTNFINHYISGEVVGNGAYAEVRECIDTRTLERCAVKIVDKNYLKRQAPQALANQEQEIKLLKRLKHDNVINLKDVFYQGQRIYIFLEYCSFVLNDLLLISSPFKVESSFDNNHHNDKLTNDHNNITGSGLSIALVRNLFKQLLHGLDYLHSQCIVHMDIKPQNLLLTNSGTLKIIDFGVSQILSLWSWPSDLCRNYEGSPLFQAPEVVSGQLEYAGFKVDVWSAGITLYLMVYGQYPFIDEALLALYDKILSDPLPLSSCLHHNDNIHLDKEQTSHRNEENKSCNCKGNNNLPVLNDLLSMMMEKDASKRCTIGEALKHPWLLLNKHNNNNDSDNNDDYDEHSEFIELLLTHQLTRRLASSSSINSLSSTKKKYVNSENRKDGQKNKNSLAKKEKEETINPSLGSTIKQRDIYLSMSVLPYLYNHHFPDKPVVKANKKRKEREELAESNQISLLSKTTSSSSASYTSSTVDSTITNSSSNTNFTNAITPSQQQSSSPATTVENSSSDPNEIIADREIEWGTERQYNLLKLPLIRANRLRDQSGTNIKMAKRKARRRVVTSSSSSSSKGKNKRKRRRSCRRKSNNYIDDEYIKSNMIDKKF